MLRACHTGVASSASGANARVNRAVWLASITISPKSSPPASYVGLAPLRLGKPIFVFRQWAGEGDIQTINHANVMTDSQRVIHYLRAVFRHLVATGDKLFSQRPENNFPALFSHVTPEYAKELLNDTIETWIVGIAQPVLTRFPVGSSLKWRRSRSQISRP